MPSISTLSTAVSALMASQTALNTTGHNLTNVNTKGFVRQQVLFKENAYRNVGNTGIGPMSIGSGADIAAIRQVRNIFLDASYREEQGRMGFYDKQAEAVNEIESILGETEGESFSKITEQLWKSLNELKKHPEGLETRGNFVQNAVIFIKRANLIMEQINDYQNNLNKEVVANVDRINEIGKQIDTLNSKISQNELDRANANDYRDQRNLLLDELSTMVNITYNEVADGTVQVSVENVPFVIEGGYFKMNTVPSEAKSNMLKPHWPHLSTDVFNFKNPVGPEHQNDVGSLKGMLMARGTRSANYTDLQNKTTYEDGVQTSVVMKAQAQFDNLIHGMVTLINNTVSPITGTPPVFDQANAPFGLNGTQKTEIFSRKYMDRFDNTTPGNFNQEDPTNRSSLYSAGNLAINPEILADYNKINLSATKGNNGDSSVVKKILDAWEAPFSTLEPGATAKMNFKQYYTGYVGELGSLGNVAKAQKENQELMAKQIDNKRLSSTGVNTDEELGNMLKYQHAYNAAAKVVSVVDTMMEQVVTSLGRVGR